jgi:nickel/cobalt exporter
MTEGLFTALAAGAVTVGSLHALAPDHWVPFAALARAQRWSTSRTIVTTALCGFGHVTVSVLLGLLGLVFGVGLLQALGERMEAVAGILLVGFGLVYGMWGLRRAARAALDRRVHGHAHVGAHAHAEAPGGDPPGLHAFDTLDSRAEREAFPPRLTAWGLFLIFSADPCVAVIPLLFASAPLGVLRTVVIVALYEMATIGTMILLVTPARAAARALRVRWVDRYGDAVAGGVIAVVGLAVAAFGW